ncbi:hypothetical protein [Nocardia sp. alder85J]|uniref:hypothetical protein n=1 Tax=Nocardia sp. alder85J TaxID=2862949 RepID=UPI001CD665E6|nr:hypothetical protein [Nocardia sp. alder85J]MCX4093611.1 hypothetical protein [Nocardia sp. alder85J]
MTLSDTEIAVMSWLGPPLIPTPRSVKRLTNSYGLFSAIQRIHTGVNTDDTRLPAMVLLAALTGFPHLGPALLTGLHAPPAGCTAGAPSARACFPSTPTDPGPTPQTPT